MIHNLIETLFNKIKENPDEYYPFKDASEWSIQRFNINGFCIEVYYDYSIYLKISKDWVIIYTEDEDTNPIGFFTFDTGGPRFAWSGKFRKIISSQVAKKKSIEATEKRLLEDIDSKKKIDFINDGIDKWISEIKGIELGIHTDEFSEVFVDMKRLEEISNEAKKIHSKYKKPFLSIFNI